MISFANLLCVLLTYLIELRISPGCSYEFNVVYVQRETEAVARRCSVKKVFLEISQNSQENTCGRVSFLIKLFFNKAFFFIKKKTLAQVFSCEFCKISKNTFSYRTPPVAASGEKSQYL